MKNVLIILCMFLFNGITSLQAQCPESVSVTANGFLIFTYPEYPSGINSVTVTFPTGETFSMTPLSIPNNDNLLIFSIPPEYSSLDFLDEFEIADEEKGNCLIIDGVLVECDLNEACLAEIQEGIQEDIHEAVNELVLENECKFWDGECGTDTKITRTGNVGIGVNNTSSATLSVGGGLDLRDDQNGWANQIRFRTGINEAGSIRHLITDNRETGRLLIYPGYGGTAQKTLEVHGRVGIGLGGSINQPNFVGGTDISSYRLYVEGGILTEEVRVRNDWADYVFADDYQLLSLTEVENFIDQNGHLPNVPSAKKIESDGMELGDIAKVQQEKIEELFLHLIRLEKEVQQLTRENKQMKTYLSESK